MAGTYVFGTHILAFLSAPLVPRLNVLGFGAMHLVFPQASDAVLEPAVRPGRISREVDVQPAGLLHARHHTASFRSAFIRGRRLRELDDEVRVIGVLFQAVAKQPHVDLRRVILSTGQPDSNLNDWAADKSARVTNDGRAQTHRLIVNTQRLPREADDLLGRIGLDHDGDSTLTNAAGRSLAAVTAYSSLVAVDDELGENQTSDIGHCPKSR